MQNETNPEIVKQAILKALTPTLLTTCILLLPIIGTESGRALYMLLLPCLLISLIADYLQNQKAKNN